MFWVIMSILFLIVGSVTFILAFVQLRNFNHFESVDIIYEEDDLISENDVNGYDNEVYRKKQASSETLLDYYMISRKQNQTFLMTKFIKPINETSLEIFVFDYDQKLIKSMVIKYVKKIDKTPMILLPEHTAFVNVDMRHKGLEKTKIEAENDKKIHKINMISMITSVGLFLVLISIAYGLLTLLSGDLNMYMNLATILLGLAMITGISIINYIGVYLWMKMRFLNGSDDRE